MRFWMTGWSWYLVEFSICRLAGMMCSGTAWYQEMSSGCLRKKVTYFLAPSTLDFSRMWKPWTEGEYASVSFRGSSNGTVASAILGLLAMVWSSRREPTYQDDAAFSVK